MTDTIKVGKCFVAFIDIVGQRDKLKQLVSLPKNHAETQHIKVILSETSEYVKELRVKFDEYFDAASKPTGKLDGLTQEKRAWAEKRKQTPMWRRGFSDSYFITIPCWDEPSWGAHSLGIYASLSGVCALFIWALAMKKPFRGAVEVGLGTEISKEEVYGSVNVRVAELEKHAGWPRVLVGDGLLNHLDNLEQQCSNNLEGRHTKICIQNCRKLFTTDHTGTIILDPLGEAVKAVSGATTLPWPHIIQSAYDFVISQEALFSTTDEKLHGYYEHLRKYMGPRLVIWGLDPNQ